MIQCSMGPTPGSLGLQQEQEVSLSATRLCTIYHQAITLSHSLISNSQCKKVYAVYSTKHTINATRKTKHSQGRRRSDAPQPPPLGLASKFQRLHASIGHKASQTERRATTPSCTRGMVLFHRKGSTLAERYPESIKCTGSTESYHPLKKPLDASICRHARHSIR